MLAFDRLITAPGVAMIANTVFINNGLEDAVALSGTVEIAETEGTPLNNLFARAYALDDKRGGNGDDLAEFAGRQCYRSWKTGRDNEDYIANVKQMGHGSIFEHASVCFQITGVSRSLTHELIRHRVGTAYSQESQRYVDANDMMFVIPPLLMNAINHALAGDEFTHKNVAAITDEDVVDALGLFRFSCQRSLDGYRDMQPMLKRLAERAQALADRGDVKAATSAQKRANEAARSLLPNASETRLVFTCNLRQMQHVLTLRGTDGADLEIRRMVVALLDNSRSYAPNFFRDVELFIGADGLDSLRSEVTKL